MPPASVPSTRDWANRVEQCGLTVIDVTHDRDNRRSIDGRWSEAAALDEGFLKRIAFIGGRVIRWKRHGAEALGDTQLQRHSRSAD